MINPGDGNPDSWLTTQYRTNGNLSRRLDLHRRFSANSQGWHRWVFDHLALSPAARILELGCGPGTLWLDNRTRVPRDWRITLSDFSPGMIDEARRQLVDVAPNISFEIFDAVSIPFDDGAFDAVIANHMLYHVPDLPATLGEIRRILSPGGRFYAATNGQRHMWELDELVRLHAPGNDMPNVAERFGLENGLEHLTPWFSAVDRHDYPDSLEVTEAEPVIQYAQSMSGTEHLTEAQLESMRRTIADSIERTGRFHVTKSAGLFTCVAGTQGRPLASEGSARGQFGLNANGAGVQIRA